ncbi:class I SAM-dependent methyltransferase [Thermocrinis jamiesonii]|uniref:class I SAM-dependent methyltransferase n=1 Tax=Thermocrinis jamiesonii TaxID=1302351 RepID=UPI000496E6D2|nr:class I SAM-dependent methyltransferase [Thermocrinis jamiesonii]
MSGIISIMNNTQCPICLTEVAKENYSETYISPYNNQEYKRYECPNCDVHWWEPLKIIPEFYESEVIESYIALHEGIGLRLGQNHEAFFEYFPQNIRGRLLDVGCGNGLFLKHAKQAGFEVWGIDFDRKSVEVARKALNTDTIYAMSLEEFYEYASKEGLKFDVITFFEVLEHQDKPREFLEMVKGLLKEGGYIAGSVPNRERLFAKDIDWKYFHGDYPPNHFLRFSKECLEKVLKLSGFSEVSVRRLDFPFKEFFPYLEKRFFGNLLDGLKHKLKAMVVGSERRARVYAVEDFDKVSEKKALATVLKALKLGRNLVLLPLALLYLGKLKGNGMHLYFQAKG